MIEFEKKWSFVVSIHSIRSNSQFCTGSIITDVLVLSAAHCFRSAINKVEKILKGSLDLIPLPSPSVKVGKFA